MNNSLEVRYARTRHYSHISKDSHKPQFTYCKIENLQALKTLLSDKLIHSTGKATAGQVGQDIGFANHDPTMASWGAGVSVKVDSWSPPTCSPKID